MSIAGGGVSLIQGAGSLTYLNDNPPHSHLTHLVTSTIKCTNIQILLLHILHHTQSTQPSPKMTKMKKMKSLHQYIPHHSPSSPKNYVTRSGS